MSFRCNYERKIHVPSQWGWKERESHLVQIMKHLQIRFPPAHRCSGNNWPIANAKVRFNGQSWKHLYLEWYKIVIWSLDSGGKVASLYLRSVASNHLNSLVKHVSNYYEHNSLCVSL